MNKYDCLDFFCIRFFNATPKLKFPFKSTSANTGVKPELITQLAEIIKDLGVTIIGSSFFKVECFQN